MTPSISLWTEILQAIYVFFTEDQMGKKANGGFGLFCFVTPLLVAGNFFFFKIENIFHLFCLSVEIALIRPLT